ncbi:MAG: GFA family protein [Xanthobacteraceae bacterium]
MKLEGGCYCGSVRYVAEGEPTLKAQCHCRECQYISGGAPNLFMLMPPDGFRYSKGTPRQFARSDLERPVTREFCGECGTHLTTRRPGLAVVILKIGTLDDPSLFGGPQMAIYTIDQQPFHQIPKACRASSGCRNGGKFASPLAVHLNGTIKTILEYKRAYLKRACIARISRSPKQLGIAPLFAAELKETDHDQHDHTRSDCRSCVIGHRITHRRIGAERLYDRHGREQRGGRFADLGLRQRILRLRPGLWLRLRRPKSRPTGPACIPRLNLTGRQLLPHFADVGPGIVLDGLFQIEHGELVGAG